MKNEEKIELKNLPKKTDSNKKNAGLDQAEELLKVNGKINLNLTQVPKKSKEKDLEEYIQTHFPHISMGITSIEFYQSPIKGKITKNSNYKIGKIVVTNRRALKCLLSSTILLRGKKIKCLLDKEQFIDSYWNRFQRRRAYFFGNLDSKEPRFISEFLSSEFKIHNVYFLTNFRNKSVRKIGFIDFLSIEECKKFNESPYKSKGLALENFRITFFDPFSTNPKEFKTKLEDWKKVNQEENNNNNRVDGQNRISSWGDVGDEINNENQNDSLRWAYLKPSIKEELNIEPSNYFMRKAHSLSPFSKL